MTKPPDVIILTDYNCPKELDIRVENFLVLADMAFVKGDLYLYQRCIIGVLNIIQLDINYLKDQLYDRT